jgi:hypothetical protein
VIAPVAEGYAALPGEPLDCLESALARLDAFDRAMAKVNGTTGALGGKYRLVREPVE